MKIAVTYGNGQVFQHFGHCKNFKIYSVEDKNVVAMEVVNSMGSGHGALSGFLQGLCVDVLICGGIGGGARTALDDAGIDFYPGVVGDADASVIAFLNDKLIYNKDAVCNHHHEDGHDCGEDKHGCGNH
ncbi:MAG: NifB/NifX family molybdenum-iron cluster-binding protein [Clostridia bacterium]